MRRKDREITQTDRILDIADRAGILHLGLFDDGYPYVVPLHYGYEYRDGAIVFFMHSAKEGHKLDLIRNNPHVCVELECDVEPVSGGDEPCQYGAYYASVIGQGTAEIIDEEKEKIRALQLLMKNQTGRDFEIDSRMAASVTVIKAVIDQFTAKARSKHGK